MVMDYMKLSSDDSYYTPDHIMFLLNKYRAYVLKSKYENSAAQPSDENYNTVTLPLVKVGRVDGFHAAGIYMKSESPLPDKSGIGQCSIWSGDQFSNSMFSWVTPARMAHVGNDSWRKNIIYVAKDADGRLTFKSCSPQIGYLESVNVRAIFTDPSEAAQLSSDAVGTGVNTAECDPLDTEFALESNLLPLVMQYVVKELSGAAYRPKDDTNNANDDLSKLAQFIRAYAKSPLARQLNGTAVDDD